MRLGVLAAVACFAVLAVPQAFAGLYVVDTTADTPSGACGLTPIDGTCSLRAAIAVAQNNDTIAFAINPAGLATIGLTSDLPLITRSITIDGTTQTGSAGAPLIQLARTGGTVGLWLGGGGVTVKGLVINSGFSNSGVLIQSSGNHLESNYIGTDAAGAGIPGTFGYAAVRVQGANNVIGGASTAERNVIASTGAVGLAVEASSGGSSGNSIRNNYIGMNATGTVSLGTAGLWINGAVGSSNVNGNVIDNGVAIDNSNGVVLKGNKIGTNAAGTASAGGTGAAAGVQVLASPNTVIGGPGAGEGNVISGNGGTGIRVQDGGVVTILGNRIGTSADGAVAVPNAGVGIETTGASPEVQVGGIGAGQANTIAYNIGGGVWVLTSAATGVVIRGNAIYGNLGNLIPIDLGGDASTANDALDADTGPNGRQNSPVLSNATQNGSGNVSVDVTLSTKPGAPTTYSLDVYAGPSCGARTWIGTTDLIVGGTGTTPVTNLTYASNVGEPDFLSATVTGPEGTSELSACTAIAGDPSGGDGRVFVVVSTADESDETTGDGICKTDGTNNCTLKAAIEEANAMPNAGSPDRIEFAIPAGGTQTISPSSAYPLPPITEAVSIDGTTQIDFQAGSAGAYSSPAAGALGVFVYGGGEGSGDGIVLAAGSDGSVIRGIAIGGFYGKALRVDSDGNTIAGNYVGTDGANAVVNTAGVVITGDNNHIGGTVASDRNVISGNGTGIGVDGSIAPVTGTVIEGNYVGVDPSGLISIPNTIGITSTGSSQMTIGGPTLAAGNIVASVSEGITVDLSGIGSGNVIRWNTIGVGSDGATDTTQSGAPAIRVTNGNGTQILDNVASNSETGIWVGSSNGVVVARNEVGTDRTGVLDRGNTNAGISVSGGGLGNELLNETIGGGAGDGNTVAHNGDGIYLSWVSESVVSDNTASDNHGAGILAEDGNLIEIGPRNTVFANTGAGVALAAPGNEGANGNHVKQNAIYNNGGLGIDLANDGITFNDQNDGACCPGDTDSGPNGRQNFPEIASATVVGGQVAIDYSLDTTPGGTYTVEFFASSAADPSNHGEGARYLGSDSITLDAADRMKSGSVSLTPPVPVQPGEAITATATDGSGSTSEFSVFRAAAAGATGSLVGSRAAPGASPIDLTAVGTLDWAVWGFANGGTSSSLTPDARKAGGTAIGALTDVNTPSPIPLRGLGQFGPQPFTFSWSNGSAPSSAASSVQTGIQHNGGAPLNVSTLGAGFQFTVPADLTPRTLRVWVALNRASGHLTATLSDGSAAAYANSYDVGVNGNFVGAVYTINYAAASPGKTLTVRWVEDGDSCAAFRCDNASLHAVALAGSGAGGDPPPLVTGMTITGPATVDAGAGIVPLKDIPPAALVTPQTSGTQAAPVNQSPVNQSPVNQLPVNQLPVNQLPVNQSPVNQLPVNQSPVNQSGLGPDFQSLAVAPGPLGDTTLATIPLRLDGGWAAFLTGTSLAATPLQSVTLRQVFQLSPLPLRLQTSSTNPLRFADIDFSRSLFGSLPAMTLALGQLPVSGIPLEGNPPVTWCALFSGPPLNCPANGSLPATTSLLSAALQGAPVNQSPVNQSPVNQSLIDALTTAKAPVNQLPVNQLPVNQLPVNQLPVNQSRILSFPVNQLPVNQSPVNQSPVNQLSLNAILVANAPVNQSPVNQSPVNQLPVNQSVLDCTGQCTGVLGDYVNKVLPGKTLGDLRRALAPGDVPDTWTIANLEDFGNLIVGDLLKSLPQPNTLTLADILALALFANNPESFAFETLNIFDTGLSLYSSPRGAAPYTVAFTLAANGGPSGVLSTVEVSVTLPRTFAHAKGTSRLVTGAGACGTGVATADPVLSQLPSGETKATWTVLGTVGSAHTLCFTARPGIVLGPQSATTSAKPTGGVAVNATAPQPVTVVDGGESSNNNAPTAPSLATTNLYLSYLTSATDVDYYRVPVPAVGTRLTFHLSHLPADYDLVVYGPSQTALRPAVSSTPPLDGAPVVDSSAELTHVTDALPSQTLDDLRLQTLPVVGVSANRGSDPEDISVLSDGSGGSYTVQVTSYNNATSADPYMLRVTTQAPLVPVSTTTRSVGGATGTPAGALPTGFNTLFLVDRQRLQSFYPGTGAGTGSALLTTLAAQQAAFQSLGFPNAVLSVDAYPAVQTAYTAWDNDPGSPDKANKVVAAINTVVDSEVRAKANGPGLKYIVIVGGDRVIPQGRLGDFTVAANESGYADTFDKSSDLYATLRAGQMLSDDPYGTLEPVPYMNRQLYIPRLSVGRLVETPAEISATLMRFGQFNGKLDPSTSLTTGYGFMQDGAAAINTPFASRFAAGAKTLISDSWLRSDLLTAFLPAAGAPAVTSLNGHADHYEFAPPSAQPPYLTSGDLPLGPTDTPAANAGKLANRLVFSMGCHSGLSVSDATVTANTYDWAQAYARNGVGAYVGNTGFGYGDSLVVAYSEQLDAIFAKKIAAGSTVGNALAAAKQEFFGGLGVFGVYDEKAMAEFTLYGLPMWSVTQPGGGLAPLSIESTTGGSAGSPQLLSVQAAAVAPTSSSLVTDASTGLQAEAFVLDNIANTPGLPASPLGSFWTGPDGVQVTHYRPLQPKAFVDVTGTSGHGALITELRQQADIAGVNPVFARPIIDAASNEPELAFGDVAFPSRLQALRTYVKDGTPAQRVVLMTGQFFTGSNPGTNGTGVQRLYTRIGARVLRSTSTDYVPPAFTRIDATKVGTTAAFAVDVTDLNQSGGAGVVKRVLVAVRSGSATTWTFTDLGQAASGSARWAGGVPLGGATTFEYFVQAVDAAGNVAVSTNKGFFFAAAAPVIAPPEGIAVGPATVAPSSGWFTGPTAVVTTGPANVTLEVSVDGGAFVAVPQGGGPLVTGDGVHTVEARGSNGGSATAVIPIDSAGSAPAIAIGAPAAGDSYALGSAVPADYTCSDAGSGVASCVGAIISGPTGVGPVANGVALPTSKLGAYTFKVTSTDVVGQSSTATTSYTVITLGGATAFVRGGKVWVVKPGAGGFAPRQLTQLAGLDQVGTWIDEQPAVSPDGLRVVFGRRPSAPASAKPQLWVIDAAGRNAKKLLDDANADYTAPDWAPGGAQIAFESNRTGSNGRDIWTASFSTASGGTLSSFTNRTNAAGDDVTPSWAPAGLRIAFATNRNSNQYEIYSMLSNGSDVKRLTNDPKTDIEPSFSPSGLLIAFSSDRAGGTGGFELYVMSSVNGNSQVRITNSPGVDGQPHFVDPLTIVFASGRTTGAGLYTIAPSAVPPVKMASTTAGDSQPG